MAQLISNLPVGAKVKFGKHQVGSETPWDITWLIVAKNHSGYPSNSVTLLAEKCLDARSMDAIERNNSNEERKAEGNNRYSVSNIDQWLNSPNESWYVSKHSADTPPSTDYLPKQYNTLGYSDRKGFQYHFTTTERSSVLTTTIRCPLHSVDGGNYEDISRKIFLPSVTEIGYNQVNGMSEGNIWEWFVGNPSRKCGMLEQARLNTLYGGKPSSSTGSMNWWIRTPAAYANASSFGAFMTTGDYTALGAAYPLGIRPAINLSNSLKVSDSTDGEGYYTFIWNAAPNKPSTITAPTIYGGKSNTISWGKATDPDGDTVTYTLECSVNGGSYTQIYSGTALSYTHLVTFGTSNVTYRVKATDPSGESSAYTTSATLTVVNNYAPVISGADANLGVKSSGFTGTYTVTDANNNTVTVTESIDGVQIRSLVATLGATITYGITGTTWLALSNGSHTLTIRATDGLDSSVRTFIFTKLVEGFTIQTAQMAASVMPTRIMLTITRNIPSSATFKVEVCNNGYDTYPVWEDATNAVKSGRVHNFSNTTNVAGAWGVVVRVTVNRNGAIGACYVSEIGGNFE